MNKVLFITFLLLALDQSANGFRFWRPRWSCSFFSAQDATSAEECADETPDEVIEGSFREGLREFLEDFNEGDEISVCEICNFSVFRFNKTVTKLIEGTVDDNNGLDRDSLTIDVDIDVTGNTFWSGK